MSASAKATRIRQPPLKVVMSSSSMPNFVDIAIEVGGGSGGEVVNGLLVFADFLARSLEAEGSDWPTEANAFLRDIRPSPIKISLWLSGLN